MSRLILMRHGPAGKPTRAPRKDAQRPLTDQGRKVVRKAARRLRRLGAFPGVILYSPRVRAAQTARILAEELDCPQALVECEALGGEGDEQQLLAVLRPPLEAASLVVAVGHQPSLGRLASWLLSGQADGLAIEMRKGGWCLLESSQWEPGTRARLLALQNPDILATQDGKDGP